MRALSRAKALLHGSLQIALPDPAEGSDDVADHVDHDLGGDRGGGELSPSSARSTRFFPLRLLVLIRSSHSAVLISTHAAHSLPSSLPPLLPTCPCSRGPLSPRRVSGHTRCSPDVRCRVRFSGAGRWVEGTKFRGPSSRKRPSSAVCRRIRALSCTRSDLRSI